MTRDRCVLLLLCSSAVLDWQYWTYRSCLNVSLRIPRANRYLNGAKGSGTH